MGILRKSVPDPTLVSKFILSPPSASTINIRRNSQQTVIADSPTATNSPNEPTTAVDYIGLAAAAGEVSASPSHDTSASSPPVTKRTLFGKIIQSSFGESGSPTIVIKTTLNNMCRQTIEEVKRCNANLMGVTQQQQHHQQQTAGLDRDFFDTESRSKSAIVRARGSAPENAAGRQSQLPVLGGGYGGGGDMQRRYVENRYPIDQCSDEDRLSIESSVFEEPKSSDPIIALSNRSSSESNKSQTTIDTGYMSASNDTDRIFFGASEDFRCRYSSVDTQSSTESCASSDIQMQQNGNARYTKLAVNAGMRRDDSQEMAGKLPPPSRSTMKTANTTIARAPIGRRTVTMPKPDVISTLSQQQQQQKRAGSQSQSSTDSARVPYGGTMFDAFHSGLARITSAAASTSEAVMGKQSIKRATQFATAKFRRDSKGSFDSFSMSTSPGYHTKSTDTTDSKSAAPPSQTSCINGTDATSIIPKAIISVARATLRQDSTVSNDSYSLTSSPGYTTKLDQPLLAKRLPSKWFHSFT